MRDDLKFTRAGIGSKEHLVRLWIDSFTQAYKDLHSSENIRSYCSEHYTSTAAKKILTDDSYTCTLVSRSAKNVGVTILHHHSCPLRPELEASELKHLYILASEYGTGLGKLMMEKAIEQVQHTRKDWIWLCVSDLNHRAQRFYEKTGFQLIGAGPVLEVGTDKLTSSLMIRSVRENIG